MSTSQNTEPSSPRPVKQRRVTRSSRQLPSLLAEVEELAAQGSTTPEPPYECRTRTPLRPVAEDLSARNSPVAGYTQRQMSTKLNIELNNIREENLLAQMQYDEDRRLELEDRRLEFQQTQELRRLEAAREREERRRALQTQRAEIERELEARLNEEREERLRFQEEMQKRLERVESLNVRAPVDPPRPTPSPRRSPPTLDPPTYSEPLDLSPRNQVLATVPRSDPPQTFIRPGPSRAALTTSLSPVRQYNVRSEITLRDDSDGRLKNLRSVDQQPRNENPESTPTRGDNFRNNLHRTIPLETETNMSVARSGRRQDAGENITQNVTETTNENITLDRQSLYEIIAMATRGSLPKTTAETINLPTPCQISHSVDDRVKSAQNVRPSTYDGSTAWAIYERQFLMIAELNKWNSAEKAATLTASLRGSALSTLSSLTDTDARDFEKICTTLKLWFGEEHLSKLYFTQFENRRQKKGEDLATLGHDLERLARSALPDCSGLSRDKIACARFINAISDPVIKHALRMAGPPTLREAIVKSLEIEVLNREDLGSPRIRQIADSKLTDEQKTKRESPATTPQQRSSQSGSNQDPQTRGYIRTCAYCKKRGHEVQFCYALQKVFEDRSRTYNNQGNSWREYNNSNNDGSNQSQHWQEQRPQHRENRSTDYSNASNSNQSKN